MSKTKLTGIPPAQVIDHFGSDAYRYYFLRELPYGSDGSFSWESMSARYTSELANDFGNLASRVTSMVERYCDGVLPDWRPGARPEVDGALPAAALTAYQVADERIRALDFQGGLIAIFELVRTTNGYVSDQQPWALAKAGETERLHAVLYHAAECLRVLAVLLNPVLPKACAKLWASLGAEEQLGPLAGQSVLHRTYGQLRPGVRVTKGEVLFPRLDEPAATPA